MNGKVPPRHGYSKAHRPHVEPILLTLLCSWEGFLILGEMHSGNALDTRLNREVSPNSAHQSSCGI